MVYADELLSSWESGIWGHVRQRVPAWPAPNKILQPWFSNKLPWETALHMCICNSLLGGLSTSCVTPLGKDSWTLSFDFPGLGTRPVSLCTYPYILTHHSHDYEYMKIPIANHWVWEWSWGPSPTTQPAKIMVFALKRDGTVGITQLLKVSLNYLLLSLKS